VQLLNLTQKIVVKFLNKLLICFKQCN